MVPYVDLPVLHLLGQPIYPYTYLVALGMVLCYVLGQRRVKAVGLYAPVSAVGLVWIAVGGFIGAHIVDVVAYYPERVLQNPLSLLAIWEGTSSFGGFIGGTVAFHIYCRMQQVWMLAHIDALVYGFAPGWIIARGGCFAAHDHPGWRSDFFLAVAYPGGARHDLGLYEVLLAAAITAVLYLWAARQKRFVGFHTALVLALYAPGRFMLDFLRTGDRRYLGLTPAQYLCGVMLALVVYLVWNGRRRRRMADPDAPS